MRAALRKLTGWERPWTAAYFGSGWAFLIPYLACYLLYAELRWPVNPGSSVGIPALLHVFWLLHLAHAVTAVVAWRGYAQAQIAAGRSYRSLLWPPMPWVCLALFLFIPGAYLEFPADPWAHFSRITEWNLLREVTAHSAWAKSSYFTAYSLVGWLPKRWLPVGIDLYQSSCGLLLLWNYYRLGRQVGLERPGAFLFATLQAVFFGNNIFTFLRYYGLSSTLVAQLAAVALVRVALQLVTFDRDSIRRRARDYGSGVLAGALLTALICYNHMQALPLAAVGIAAVILQKLIARRPTAIKWLVLAAIASALIVVMWWPRQPAVAEFYRPRGWLNSSFGINLLSRSSPALERAMHIFGLLGVINLLAGLVLVWRNHVAAWLTLLPVFALLHPLVALPLANFFAGRNLDDIVVFHRLFFAIPCGLALVMCGQLAWNRQANKMVGDLALTSQPRARATAAFGLVLGLLVLSVTISAAGPWYSRLWNAVAITPDDLAQLGFQRDAAQLAEFQGNSPALVVGSSGLSFVANAYATSTTLYDPLSSHRLYHFPAPRSPAGDLQKIMEVLAILPHQGPTLLFGRTIDLISPQSTAAILSNHWLPQETALEVAGRPELLGRSFMPSANKGDALSKIAYRPAFPGPGGFTAVLRPIFLQSNGPDTSAPRPQLLYAASLPQLPKMDSGKLTLTAQLSARDRPWANLIMITAVNGVRGIYLYVRCETGDLYYEFFGHTAGPFRSVVPVGALKKIEFKWSDNYQELLIDHQQLAQTTFKVPRFATASYVRVGWIEPGDVDFWRGRLTADALVFGSPTTTPAR